MLEHPVAKPQGAPPGFFVFTPHHPLGYDAERRIWQVRLAKDPPPHRSPETEFSSMTYANDFAQQLHAGWEALGEGAPTLLALAYLCGKAIVDPPSSEAPLSTEAQAILAAACATGAIEIRGVKSGFTPADRQLAVYVYRTEDEQIAFRDREDPAWTGQCLNGFIELCRTGMVLHQLHRDFFLTQAGFRRAATVDRSLVQATLDRAVHG
jgi:hypothetical protein